MGVISAWVNAGSPNRFSTLSFLFETTYASSELSLRQYRIGVSNFREHRTLKAKVIKGKGITATDWMCAPFRFITPIMTICQKSVETMKRLKTTRQKVPPVSIFVVNKYIN